MWPRRLSAVYCLVVVLFLFPAALPSIANADNPTILNYGSGNDTISIEVGDYVIDGGGGSDTLQLPLFPDVYQFTSVGSNRYTAQFLDYTLTIDNVESVRFGAKYPANGWDFTLTLPIDGLVSGEVQSQLVKLTDIYLAYFGRAPDVIGLEYWQQQLLTGTQSFDEIIINFAYSNEAKALFPQDGSNKDFIKKVYENCFDRAPDLAGWYYWAYILNGGDPNAVDWSTFDWASLRESDIAENGSSPTNLTDRGLFIAQVLLGAYAATSGEEDRNLLTNRHEVALDYVNRLSAQPEEGFDEAINDLLALVTADAETREEASHILFHVFAETLTLSEVLDNASLLNELRTHDPAVDVDADGDGYSVYAGDCDDSNGNRHPGATEIYDLVDNDCDGETDEDYSVWYRDADGDGFGDADNSTHAVSKPAGYVASHTDCNDAQALSYPGNAEVYDGIDNDCDGSIDEGFRTWYRDADGDGFGKVSDSTHAVSQPTGYVTDNTDCNDAQVLSYPGNPEIYDGIDNDCDGSVDEEFTAWYRDADGDGYGDATDSTYAASQPVGYVAVNTDCNDNEALSYPGNAEVHDGIDNDCDGIIDNDFTLWYRDADGDGYGDATDSTYAISQPVGYVAVNTDCNDNEALNYPGNPEVYDGIDNDCDGGVDEGFVAWYLDFDDDSYGDANIVVYSTGQPEGYVDNTQDCNDNSQSINPNAIEVCGDGIDSNCDGLEKSCVYQYTSIENTPYFIDIKSSQENQSPLYIIDRYPQNGKIEIYPDYSSIETFYLERFEYRTYSSYYIDNIVYINNQSSINVYETTDDGNLHFLHKIPLSGLYDIYINNNYLFSGTALGFNVYDITEPSNPSLVAVHKNISGRNLDAQTISFIVDGDYAYVATRSHAGYGDGTFEVIDVSDPPNPSLVGSLNNTGIFDCLAKEGDTIFIAEGGGSHPKLFIVDVSNPREPTTVNTLSVGELIAWHDITVKDNVLFAKFAYYSDGEFIGGTRIYDVSDLNKPSLKKEFNYNNVNLFPIYTNNNLLFNATSDTINIYNINNVIDPVLIGSAPFKYNFRVVGNYIFSVYQDSSGKLYTDIYTYKPKYYTIKYTPNDHYSGSDSFSISAKTINNLQYNIDYELFVENIYDPPSVNAGVDLQVRRNEIVQLDAGGSRSPDDLPLTYHWVQTAGPSVFFDDADNQTPQFIAPSIPTQLTFRVDVNDGTTVVSDTVNVTVVYDAPVVDAGVAQTVGRGKTVMLDASASFSPEGSALTWLWEQTGGPEVMLSDPHASIATFTAPQIFGTFFFKVTVSDGFGSSSDTVSVTVANQLPVAMAGADKTVGFGETVTLNGDGSYDPDEMDTPTYWWIMTWGPDGVALNSPETLTPSFTAPSEPSVLVFELAVEDGQGGRVTDEVVITVEGTSAHSFSLQSTGVGIVIPAGSDVPAGQTSYVTFGANSHVGSSGIGTATLLDGGAPSLGFLNDSTGSTLMLGVHIPNSMSPYLDQFPELSAYLVGNGMTTVSAESTALGMLLLNPYMLQTAGEQRMAFLGMAIVHPSFSSLSNRVTTLLAIPGNRLDAVMNDLYVKNWYGLIIKDLIDMVVPDLEQGTPYTGSAPSTLSRSLAATTNSVSDQPEEDAGREISITLQKPMTQFRNPFFVYYGADIHEDPQGSDSTVFQYLSRRSKLVTLKWLIGAGESFATTPYPFHPNTPYRVELTREGTVSSCVVVLQSIFVICGIDTEIFSPQHLFELVTDLDYTPALNILTDLAGGNYQAAGVSLVNLIGQNSVILYEHFVTTMGETIAHEILKDFLEAVGKQASGAGLIIAGIKIVNSAGPLIFDLYAAPKQTCLDVNWETQMGYNEVEISSPCSMDLDDTPLLSVDHTDLSGIAPLTVTFDASASMDPNGDALYYSYTLNPVTKYKLASTAIYTHTFSRPGRYTMEVAVSDGEFGDVERFEISVEPPYVNQPPAAEAGPNRTVAKGANVYLDGSLSSDPETDPLTYQWTQVSGTRRPIAYSRTATPNFAAPYRDDTLLFKLTVSDGDYSSSDVVQVVVGSPEGGALGMTSSAQFDEGSTVNIPLSLAKSVASDTVVWLSSQPAGVVELPPYLLIPAGQTSAVVPVKVLVDSDYDNESFTLSAEAVGWTPVALDGQVREIYTADIVVGTTGVPGASWTISGPGLSETNSGAKTFYDVIPGSYRVIYQPVTGYSTPSSQTKTVGASGYYTFTGSYTYIPPNTADIYVTTIGAPNASWRLSGPSHAGTYSGAKTFYNVTPGTYTVTFNDVAGYHSPSPQSKYIGTSGTWSVTGTYYTQDLEDVTVTKKNNILLTLYDHGAIDGDRIDVYLNGSLVLSNHTLAGAPGTVKSLTLNSGPNTLAIKALNTGTVEPNTARLIVSDVSSGDPEKTYNLYTNDLAGFNLIAP